MVAKPARRHVFKYMTTSPPITNPVASEANQIIKILEGILVPIAQNAIIAAVPALGLPVVKQITEAIETALANQLTKMAEQGVTFAIIDAQTDSEQDNLSADQAALIEAEKSGNQQEIQQDMEKYAQDNSALINDDGSSPPQ
jgi:hypothetical protein